MTGSFEDDNQLTLLDALDGNFVRDGTPPTTDVECRAY